MTKRSQPYPDGIVTKVLRIGGRLIAAVFFAVAIVVAVAAFAFASAAPSDSAADPGPIVSFVERVGAHFEDWYASRISRQADRTSELLAAQPGLEARIVNFATANYETMGGAPEEDPGSGERVGAREVSLLAIGSPGCVADAGDAYVLFWTPIESQADDRWSTTFVTLDIARVHLAGLDGYLFPVGGTLSYINADLSDESLTEEAHWPEWMRARADDERRRGAVAEGGGYVPASHSGRSSTPKRTAVDGAIDGSAVASQPDLVQELERFVDENATSADVWVEVGQRIDPERLSVKLLGVARKGELADAYVLLNYRYPAEIGHPETVDTNAARIQLKGAVGALRPTRIVRSDEKGTSGADFMDWPQWAREAVIGGGQ